MPTDSNNCFESRSWQFALLLTLTLVATTLQPAATARPLADVTASGRLLVSIYADYPPYAFRTGGELRGTDVDLGRALAVALGVEVDYLVRPADENVDDDLRINLWKGHYLDSRVADVMMHVPSDDAEFAARNDQVVISGTYYTERMAVLFDTRVIEKLPTFATFAYDRIAVEVDTAADFFLLNAFARRLLPNVRHGLTFTAAARLFRDGDAAALMATRGQLEWVAADLAQPIAIAEPPMPGIVRTEWPVGIAVKHDSVDLGVVLTRHIDSLRTSGRLAEIFATYGVTYQAPTH